MLTINVSSALFALVIIGQVSAHFDKGRENDNALELTILTTWDGRPIDHRPAEIELKALNDSSFEMNVEAAFFDDPGNPGGEVGQPFLGLWEYEVVELFLANDKNQYVEIELGPWGQHIVLLLDGTRNSIKDSLPLEYTAKIHRRGDGPPPWAGGWHNHGNNTSNDTNGWHGPHDHGNKSGPSRWFGHGRPFSRGGRHHGGPFGPGGPFSRGPGGRGRGNCWEGRAIIPSSYLPPNVTKVNAYAIHGSGENRTYEALYPVPSGKYTNPDFHRLEYFQPINTSIFLTEPVTTLSSVWQESIGSPKSAVPTVTDSVVAVEAPVEKENELFPPTEILSVFEESTDAPSTEAGTTESVTESE